MGFKLAWHLCKHGFRAEYNSDCLNQRFIFTISMSKNNSEYDLFLNGQFVTSNSITGVMRHAEQLI